MEMILLFLAGVSLGFLTGRISTFGGRGGIHDVGLLRAILRVGAAVATLTLVLGGFVWLSWYWPLIGIGVGSAIAVGAVTRNKWASLFALQPIIDAVTIFIGGYWLLSG